MKAKVGEIAVANEVLFARSRCPFARCVKNAFKGSGRGDLSGICPVAHDCGPTKARRGPCDAERKRWRCRTDRRQTN